jgi:serine/threonine protein kinase
MTTPAKYGSYEVDKRMGTGAFAQVWRVINQPLVVKVYSDSDMKYYKNELRMLNAVDKHEHILSSEGAFVYIHPNFDISPCIMFTLMGDHVGRLLRYYYKNESDGLTLQQVSYFAGQILAGLAHIHERNVVHGDIKPENILMNVTALDAAANVWDVKLKICDFGSSTTNPRAGASIGTTGYMAPELIIGTKFDTSADIWSTFCVFYELHTATMLFDVYNEAKLNYGEDVKKDLEGVTETSCDEYQLSYINLLLIEKMLGPAPKEFTLEGRTYFNARGKLKNNPQVEHIGIADHLINNYTLNESCTEFVKFLLTGLKYKPEERIRASAALKLDWLMQPMIL